ncbi:MAG: hypothetical protein KGL19_02240, partial [Bacteroidota bacterium]|nr:hypothetical protein [Bacteroidota bacterium]
MKSPLNWIDKYIDASVIGYGTAADQQITNIRELRKLVLASRKQSAGKILKAIVTNSYKPIFYGENTVVFKDEIKLSIGKGKNAHKMLLRFTTVFLYKTNKWKLIAFHGSLPDLQSTMEDTFHIDRVKQQVAFLEQKVEEKTKELQTKNNELLIEAALEKVRSRSLAMHHSDEIKEVILEVLQKLKQLGIAMENRSAIIFVYEEGVKDFYQWVASPEHSAALSVATPYFDSPIHHDIWKARKKETNFYAKSYSVEVKNHFFKYFFEHSTLKLIPAAEKKWLLSRQYYELAIAFEKHSAVLIANFTADLLDAGVHHILKTFANVFEQAYIRFSDLQKAEAQAREAQIQLALERVRARTMAMQKSDELSETVFILFNQFKELGEKPDQATIGIINEKENVIEYWVTMYGKQKDGVFKFSIDEPYVTNKIYKGWKENKKSLVIELSGKELLEFASYRAGRGGAKFNPEEKRRIINVAFFSKGLLNVQSNEDRSEESIRLLERFATVFEQTYTRFLDLQKAEVQAREAQIEAALERVRSRSMAMHKSTELKEVIRLVLAQFVHLNINVEHAGFYID